ncbi:MAG TPA: hypothetical protein VF389_04795, partial [Woeseiaceae bacterium]
MSTSRVASLPVSLFLFGLLIACVDTDKNSSNREATENDTTYKLGSGGSNSESRYENPYLTLVSI